MYNYKYYNITSNKISNLPSISLRYSYAERTSDSSKAIAMIHDMRLVQSEERREGLRFYSQMKFPFPAPISKWSLAIPISIFV